MKPLDELRKELIREMWSCCKEEQRTDENMEAIEQLVQRVVRYHGKGFGRVPDHMWEGLLRWILFGIEAGDFMRNMLKNRWMETFQYADEANTAAMEEWSMVVYNDVPLQCRGQHYRQWTGLLND